MLAPDGTAIIEVQNAKHLTFDQIYHEHVFYFTKQSLGDLFEQNGLVINEIEFIPEHGGSLRAFVSHGGLWTGISTLVDWYAFAKKSREIMNGLDVLFSSLPDKRIAGFGASAKATVLLHSLQTRGFIDYIVDDTPEKQLMYIPGTSVKVMPREYLEKVPPDYLFIFCWNYAEDVMRQFPEFKGRFIIPFPEPRIQ